MSRSKSQYRYANISSCRLESVRGVWYGSVKESLQAWKYRGEAGWRAVFAACKLTGFNSGMPLCRAPNRIL